MLGTMNLVLKLGTINIVLKFRIYIRYDEYCSKLDMMNIVLN